MANDFELINQGIIDVLGADSTNKLENEKDIGIYFYGAPEIGPKQVGVDTPSIAVQLMNGRFRDSKMGDGFMDLQYEISIYMMGPNAETANKTLQDFGDRVRKSIDTNHTLNGTAHDCVLEAFSLSNIEAGDTLAYVWTWLLTVTVVIREA